MSRSVIMVLFGNEFDADEGAEVGRGLRGGEGERADLAAVGFLDGLSAGEGKVAEGHPVVDGHADYGDLIGAYHVLMTRYRPRELTKSMNGLERAAAATTSSCQATPVMLTEPVGPPVDVATEEPLT